MFYCYNVSNSEVLKWGDDEDDVRQFCSSLGSGFDVIYIDDGDGCVRPRFLKVDIASGDVFENTEKEAEFAAIERRDEELYGDDDPPEDP